MTEYKLRAKYTVRKAGKATASKAKAGGGRTKAPRVRNRPSPPGGRI